MIYLDYNSTTPVDHRVIEAMIPFLKNSYGNPSSINHFGQQINRSVETARKKISGYLNANNSDIIFTSGATESINMAIKGVAELYYNKGQHIVTVSTEHRAVLDSCKNLEEKGFEITYLKVDRNGLIDLEELKEVIRADTILVSIMLVNNETGVIQPIKEISKITQEKGVLLMTDATQAVGRMKVDVEELNVDILCFSGHKMYAPKGIGGLFLKSNGYIDSKFKPLIHGGGQEKNIRGGTLNVPGIIALAKAFEISDLEMSDNQKQITELRDLLEFELLKIPNSKIIAKLQNRIYNTVSICFDKIDANTLIARMKDIAVSNGSACSSSTIQGSHVYRAMGLTEVQARQCIRFSLGKFNTLDDVLTATSILKKLIKNA